MHHARKRTVEETRRPIGALVRQSNQTNAQTISEMQDMFRQEMKLANTWLKLRF